MSVLPSRNEKAFFYFAGKTGSFFIGKAGSFFCREDGKFFYREGGKKIKARL